MIELCLAAAVAVLLAVFARGFARQGLRPIVTVAIFSALGTVGRVAIVIPSVQPVSFFVIMSGILFGPGAGLLCGVSCTLLSSLFLGFGPYMPWQLFLWGVMGLTAGLVRRLPFWIHAPVGFAWGFVFGWCMNLWYYTLGLVRFSWPLYIAACAASFPMDLAHSLTNLILLGTLTLPIIKIYEKRELMSPDRGQ